MQEKIPIPEQRKPHSRFWEGVHNKFLFRQISNLAGYHLTQEGTTTSLTSADSVTVHLDHCSRYIRVHHSRGEELQDTTVLVVWDEVYGNKILPYVRATRRTLVEGVPVGEDEVYDSSFEPGKNTLSLGAIKGELGRAVDLVRQREAASVMLQVPTSTVEP